LSQDGIGIFPVQVFALFGDLYFAVESPCRLRSDRVVGGSSASAHRSSSPVEQCQLYVALVSHSMETTMCLEDLPRTRKHPAILVRIRVPQHYILPPSPPIEHRHIVWRRPQRAAKLRTVTKVFDESEQRPRHKSWIDPVAGRGHVNFTHLRQPDHRHHI